jgi:D-galactarolactone cycloisomerase
MYGFRELIRRHAVDIVQPDVCAAGGFTETRKIAAMAHAWGIRCVPHVWGTVVALAAGAHFLAALPDTVDSMNPAQPMLEFDRSQNPIRDQLWPLPFDFAHGEVTVRDNPGLGLVVDESLLDRYLEPRFSIIGETEAGRRPWWTGQEHELV